MAVTQSNKIEDIPVISFEEFFARVRQVGVPAEEKPPLQLPADEKEQWALLAPYVGRPLKDIPRALILLFTSQTSQVRDGNQVQVIIRKLPPAEKQVQSSSMEEVFI